MSQQWLFDPPGKPSRRNQVIEAGAGTGKTTRLVSDVLRYLLEEPARDASRVVLMTFTEKAAGEIAARIRSGLIEVRSILERGGLHWPSSEQPIITFSRREIATSLDAARAHSSRLDAIRSQTIHSFCQSLLRAWPLDAGVNPSFSLIEGFERDRLLDDAFESWIAEELSADSARVIEWADALEYAGSLESLREHLVSLIPRRGILEERRYSLGTLSELQRIAEEHLSVLAGIDDETVNRRKNREALEELRAFARETRSSEWSGEEWRIVTERISILHERLTLNDFPTDMRPSWNWLRQIPAGDLLARHRSALAYRELAIRYFAAVDDAKRREGVLDFDDLLEAADRLLQNPQRASEIRSRFDVFFLDEFQDTDRVQARILDRLIRDSSGTLIPGRVTVVGDPKQSIYSFRRAEPEIFHATLEQYQRDGAQLDILDTQYRSDPPLLTAINAMFRALFGSGERRGPVRQPAYNDLVAGRAVSRRAIDARVRFLAAEADLDERGERAEAEAVAEWISAHRNRQETGDSADLRRFAILLRKRTNMGTWADVFERRGIELEMPSPDDLLSQRGSIDLLAVLQAVADSSDRAAKVSAARSIFFGLPDDVIVGAMLSQIQKPEWTEFSESLRRWRAIALARGTGAVIDAILHDRDTALVLRLVRGGDRWLARIDHLRRRAAEFDYHGRGSLRAFVRDLMRRREEGGEADPPSFDEGRNVVRLMTVHAAKGLEFDTVILPELGARTQRGGIDAFTVDAAGALVMSSPASINRVTASVEGYTLKELQTQREEWERDRLFYVAVTRARCEVVFTAVVDSPRAAAEGGRPSRPHSEFWKPLSAIFDRRPRDFDALFPESYEERLEDLVVGGESIRVAFERIEPRRATDTPLRFVPGFSPAGLETAAPLHPVAPPQRLAPGEIARRIASSARKTHGVALHRVLELWDGASPVLPLEARAARELGLGAEERERLHRELSGLEGSAGWTFIRESVVIARELPLVIAVSGQTQEVRLDLLVRDSSGRLTVVDYKTGQWSSERAVQDCEQVSRYGAAVTEMTGEECAGLIWYIGDDRLVPAASGSADH